MTARLKGISANGGPLAHLPASTSRESWQGLSMTGLAVTVARERMPFVPCEHESHTLKPNDLEKVNDNGAQASSTAQERQLTHVTIPASSSDPFLGPAFSQDS